jgi:hypothetical protein
MSAKLKHLRQTLRKWQQQLSNLAKTIENNKSIIMLLDIMEEFRDLSLEEWNFKNIVHEHLEGPTRTTANILKTAGQN